MESLEPQNHPPSRKEPETAKTHLEPGATFLLPKIPEDHFFKCYTPQKNVQKKLSAKTQPLSSFHLNRLISFQDGSLEVESGFRFDQILDVFLNRGYLPSVLPPFLTTSIGAAIANDIFGDNHHRMGSFGNSVKKLTLLRSREGLVNCSPEENTELFCATIGGRGLTGMIVSANVELRSLESSEIYTETQPFSKIEELPELFNSTQNKHEYFRAWVDPFTVKDQFGRGLFYQSSHMSSGKLERQNKSSFFRESLHASLGRQKLYLKIFNKWKMSRSWKAESWSPLEDFFFGPQRLQFTHPSVQNWQAVLPEEDFLQLLRAVLIRLQKEKLTTISCQIQRLAASPPVGILSLPFQGYALSLLLKKTPALTPVLHEIENLVCQAGGRLTPQADSLMSQENFHLSFPQFNEFKRWIDPQFCSPLIKRISK